MAVPVLMPRMGYDTQEAIVVKWLKAEGDHVNLGEDIAEIETDKAIVPMPSGSTGTLLKQLAAEGDTVPVGQALAVIGQPGEEISDLLASVARRHQPRTALHKPGRTASHRRLPPHLRLRRGKFARRRLRGSWRRSAASTWRS